MINAAAVIERHCTVLMHYDKSTPPNEDEIREELESKEVEKKISGLKTLISLLLNGEVMPKLLMTVIRFCVPCDDHKVKKLLLVYWEVVEKVGPDGKLVPEMILVTDRLRNDLVHANEYIRGCTLRFLCKLKEVRSSSTAAAQRRQQQQQQHLPHAWCCDTATDACCAAVTCAGGDHRASDPDDKGQPGASPRFRAAQCCSGHICHLQGERCNGVKLLHGPCAPLPLQRFQCELWAAPAVHCTRAAACEW